MAEQKQKTEAPAETAPPERPRFLVTQDPGAYIHGFGFVKPGDSFVAPEGYEPSYTMRPMNKAAQVALEKLKKRIAEIRQQRKEKQVSPNPEDQINTEIVTGSAPELPVKPETVTPEELARLREEGGKRAADR